MGFRVRVRVKDEVRVPVSVTGFKQDTGMGTGGSSVMGRATGRATVGNADENCG